MEGKFKSIEDEANKGDEYNKELEEARSGEEKAQTKLKTLTEKSDSFQSVMTDANEFFNTVKKEMDKIGTKIKNLDTDNTNLQKKLERNDITAMDLVDEVNY